MKTPSIPAFQVQLTREQALSLTFHTLQLIDEEMASEKCSSKAGKALQSQNRRAVKATIKIVSDL